MDQYREVTLNLYMGCIYGGLLYFVTDFSLFLVLGTQEYKPYLQYPRYFLASVVSTLLYTSSLPLLKWSIAKDLYRSSLWKMDISLILFFSTILPLATFICTEEFGDWIVGHDPLSEKRFHVLVANGFSLTMILEFGKVFDTYRMHYLQDIAD